MYICECIPFFSHLNVSFFLFLFYVSVGSLGKRIGETDVKRVTVTNCTLTNTTNGVRIKTYRESPSLMASNITFDDIIMNDVHNPIVIDQNYASRTKREVSSFDD